MPYALSIGVEYDVFWHLNPKKLNAFIEAYKMRMKELDLLVHAWVGNYGISALCVSIANCFNKTSNAKYIEHPIMRKEYENENFTQEELDKRELKKMLLAEEMWAKQHKRKGLPETVIL